MRGIWGGGIFLLCALTPLSAQRTQPVVGEIAVALSAERRGDLPQAAAGFLKILAERPGDGLALLGASRVLPTLDRREELMPLLGHALAIDTANTRLLGLAVRNWALLGRSDSARVYALRWAALFAGDEEPFREWALSALEIRDRVGAKAALELGRARIDHPAALAPELAQLRQAEGDLAGATDEWLRAVSNAPTYLPSAVLLLGVASPKDQSAILNRLKERGSPEAHRIRGLLRVRWGEPEEGMAELAAVVPDRLEGATVMIRLALDDLAERRDPEARRAAARGYELLAAKQIGAERLQSWMAAASAWADAGKESEARRLLGLISADPAAPADVAAHASHTLLGVLLAEGSVAAAESLYTTIEPRLTLDERDLDQRRLAFAWAMRADFDRADALLERDSSVAGFDMKGRVRALAGDLSLASEWLRLAGPYADERLAAVERVQLLALVSSIGRDTLPAFGAALRTLEAGDTARAITGFAALAHGLDSTGAAAVHLFAADLALARRDTATAVHLAEAASGDSAAASAPAARLLRARILAERGQVAAAISLLESVILDFPASAVVPEARRLRDQYRGAVPRGGGG